MEEAQKELDDAMKEYMLENNVHYFDYPLKFDEYFLTTHQNILAQIRNNNIVRFQYAGTSMALYIKQISIRYGDGVLPQWDITLTDDVEIVLNKIGQVTDDVSRMRVQLTDLQRYYSENVIALLEEKLSKVSPKDISRTAKERRAGSLGYAEALLISYNKNKKYPLSYERLYTHKAPVRKRSTSVVEDYSPDTIPDDMQSTIFDIDDAE